MNWIVHISALIRIALALALIMLLLRLRLHLGFGMIAGSVFLALLFPTAPSEFFAAAIGGLFSTETIFLVILVVGVLVLSNGMNSSGHIERLIGRFRALVGESRIMLVAFPSMIGLLPMPGGAVFSAPMIEEASRQADLTPALKSVINYWFRHLWEYWFPLYPGVILAIALTGIQPAQFILRGLPMSLIALGAGYLVLLRSIRLGGGRSLNLTVDNIGRFLYEMIPVLIMVAALMLLGPPIQWLGSRLGGGEAVWIKRSPILIGLALSLGWVIVVSQMKARQVVALFINKNVWSMALLVIGLMVFKSVLNGSGAIVAIKEELIAHDIPLTVLVAVLPLIAGLIMGIAMGFVGVSFPVVLSLLETSGIRGAELAPYIFLAYSWGYAGMMLSPVHLCLILTRDYFRAELLRIYAWLVPLGLAIMLGAVGLFLIYH